MERPREDQEYPGNLVGVMELDPLFQFFPEAGGRDPDGSDSTGETCVLKFFGGEGLDAFGVNHLFRGSFAGRSASHGLRLGHTWLRAILLTISSTLIFSNLALI